MGHKYPHFVPLVRGPSTYSSPRPPVHQSFSVPNTDLIAKPLATAYELTQTLTFYKLMYQASSCQTWSISSLIDTLIL